MRGGVGSRADAAGIVPSGRAALGGTVAGAIATIPMSAVVLAADAAGFMGREPPVLIVARGFAAAGVASRAGVRTTSAVVAHGTFGAAAGALSGLEFGAGRRVSERPAIARGAAYGLLVYTASYAVRIPALRILSSPRHDQPGRQAAMIAAHAVCGAALAALGHTLLPTRVPRPVARFAVAPDPRERLVHNPVPRLPLRVWVSHAGQETAAMQTRTAQHLP